MIKQIVVVIIILCLCYCGCTDDKTEFKTKKPIYILSIGSFDEEYSLEMRAVGTEGVGGRVVIRINDNPVVIHSASVKTMQINHFLRPGNNVITVEGAHEKKLAIDLGVLGIDSEKLDSVLYHVFPEVSEENNTTGIEFQAEIDALWSFYLPENKIVDSAETRKSLEDFIAEIHSLMQQHDAEVLTSICFAGMREWQPAGYGVTGSELSKLIEKGRVFYSNPDSYDLGSLDISKIKMIFGPNMIYVYGGVETEIFEETNEIIGEHTYLFKVDINGKEKELPHLQIVRTDGKWSIW